MTLLEMDLGALFADEAKLKALQGKIGPGMSLSEVKPYLKDIKGIKIDGPSISGEFKGQGLGLGLRAQAKQSNRPSVEPITIRPEARAGDAVSAAPSSCCHSTFPLDRSSA